MRSLPQIAHSTGIAQNRAASCHVHWLIVFLWCWRPHPRLPGNGPPSHSNDKDPNHANHVLDPRLAPVLALLHNLRQRIFSLTLAPKCAAHRARRSPSALRWESIAETPAKKRRSGIWSLGGRAPSAEEVVATRVARLVVETLGNENTIGDTEVYGNGNNDRH